MTRAFLCNSGAEAVEAAIKFARLSTGRTGIVAAMRGFHGRTMGALSATWNKAYREPFEPLVPGFVHVPYNDLGGAGRGRLRRHRGGDPGSGAGRGRRAPGRARLSCAARKRCAASAARC